jgi:hypothetical protein
LKIKEIEEKKVETEKKLKEIEEEKAKLKNSIPTQNPSI